MDASQKPSRPLFGEIGTGPVFPPPKPQESPRSPSPVRNLLPNDLLRPETSRSVSAPSRPSAIDKRRTDLARSGLGMQQVTAEDLRAKEQERAAAAAEAQAKAEAAAAQQLEDDEDERVRTELTRPVSPCQQLYDFVYHQQNSSDDKAKSGIPGQIERLYKDINSMIDTLGINARSLSAFMLYQQGQEPDNEWPDVLKSETPLDSLNDEWVLDDITRLREGETVLIELLERHRTTDVASKLQECQDLLSKDLFQLRTKLISLRKTIHSRSDTETARSAPLSAEQASLQHDLRKTSTLVQTRLAEVEQTLTVLRAKLALASPGSGDSVNGAGKGVIGRSSSQRKPTVEAVTNTIAKMTAMAERKSTDIDFLEAQLRKMGLGAHGSANGSRQGSVEPEDTPQGNRGKLGSSMLGRTPASAVGSVYHTPDSKFGDSTRSTPGTGRRSLMASVSGNGPLVSLEDRERWAEKSRRKKEVAKCLKEVLFQRRKKMRSLTAS